MQETPSPPEFRSENRTLMLILSYLWILALVPLLVEKEDSEVQWHAKHGLVLLGAEFVLWIALAMATSILTVIPVLGALLPPLLGCGIYFAILVLHIIAMIKAVRGERLTLPVITGYVDQWK